MSGEEAQSPRGATVTDERQSRAAPQPGCLVVGVGASAGGLGAFEEFFTHMPPHPSAPGGGMAFVIVQHLAPDHASLLPELLAKYTRMPVRQVATETPVAPDHVYVIPPDAALTIKGGILRVESPPIEPHTRRASIDGFFRSLAADQGGNAVCILFSGAGTDGTLGLQAVKEYGGMAMAQTPESAQYDSLLRSAIATGLVDHILPVARMPAKLIEYATYLTARRETPGAEDLRQEAGNALSTIHTLLRRHTGHDFSQYKESTIIRRLRRRMQALQLDAVDTYVTRLRQDSTELAFLFKDLLIGVTHFFRDAEAFAVLAEQVIPQLFADKGADGQIRVCVAGCATGEEAYSLAMLLCEHMDRLDSAPRVQVFATDIDDRAVETARRGCYPAGIAEYVTAERLERFFVKQDTTYQVKKELRELCIFSVHSFIKDPPFLRLDLLSCRNVLIYLGPILQQKLLPLFHYAIRPGGYLFLGPSEALSGRDDLFRTLDQKHRIFQKKEVVPRPRVEFPLADGQLLPSRRLDGLRHTASEAQDIGTLAQRAILQDYAPAGVVLTAQGEVVYFSGRTGHYLEPPAGAPNVNIFNMAREGLRLPLRTALHQAVTRGERVMHEQILVKTNGDVQPITLIVQPLTTKPDVEVTLYLVIFQEVGPARSLTHTEAEATAPSPEDEHIRRLEGKLQATEARLRSTIEEMETANEELQSTNEEFQSTNEELETSKEELQSLNEGLETVNAELRRKVEDLNHANSDLQNLLNSTQIATLFLDSELRIRSFTATTRAIMRLTPSDVARPIADFAQRFIGADLVTEAQTVLGTLATRERYVRMQDANTRYLMRVLPYRTVENRIDGVVIAFLDVTDLKDAEEAAHAAQVYAESLVATIREPLVVLDATLRVRTANHAFHHTFHIAPEDTEHALLYDLSNGSWNIPDLRHLLEEVLQRNEVFADFEVTHDFPAIGRKTMLLNARLVKNQPDQEALILLAIEDISERKQAETELTRQMREVERVNEELQQFSRIVSHDLNEPLRTMTTFVTLLASRYQGTLDATAQEYMAFVTDAAQRMQQMITDLLAYTRMSGPTEAFTAVDGEALLTQVLTELRDTLAEAKAEVTHDPLPTMQGDETRLGRVFQNLMSNAVKFRGQEPPRIHVSAQRDGPRWRFCVRDNGIGIDPDQAKRLFQVFQRLHARREYPGTGI
ncbi:MAG: PAS domain-containing protein, partial [Deltaproteobacteria bacterium]|nr:PAS domain-containing protein [Deltaproteobacteria bacterium]